MLHGHGAVSQALLGTFFTWGMTAAGAALVFVFSSGQRRILDGSLGFAAGVMLAASYWSLLAPAVEMATSSGGFGAFAFFPVAVGFTLGAAFVYLADLLMPHLGAAEDPQMALALTSDPALVKKKSDPEGPTLLLAESELSIRIDKSENGEAYQRKKVAAAGLGGGPASPASSRGNLAQPGGSSWRRIALLILAITIHNVPALTSASFSLKHSDLVLVLQDSSLSSPQVRPQVMYFPGPYRAHRAGLIPDSRAETLPLHGSHGSHRTASGVSAVGGAGGGAGLSVFLRVT
uniref:Solute carrier family 39 member 11 n=1 Tax=Oryctolagus cuniculus TaxID=9986 RepID=A0A5F9DNN0_RABIT